MKILKATTEDKRELYFMTTAPTIGKISEHKGEQIGVPGNELYYTKSKNKLNSLYGMCAQNPAKQQFLFTNGDSVFELDKEKTCQMILEEMIEEVYKQGAYFVYTDTDSVKYLGEVDWTEYNSKRIKASTASGSFADDPNVPTFLGLTKTGTMCYNKYAAKSCKQIQKEK